MGDVNFADSQIHVRAHLGMGKAGKPKSKASKAPVPLHPLLAEFMQRWKHQLPHSQPTDWVFPSMKLKGKQPRVPNMLIKSHARPAAAKASILSSHRNDKGDLVEDDPRRFGFHNLRHSLASFLVRAKTDLKTVQVRLPSPSKLRLCKLLCMP